MKQKCDSLNEVNENDTASDDFREPISNSDGNDETTDYK